MQELVLKVGGLDAVQKPCLGASSQEHSGNRIQVTQLKSRHNLILNTRNFPSVNKRSRDVLTLKTARFH